MSFFDHMAAAEQNDVVTRRQALALARARANRRFANFLDASRSEDERAARLALVAGDLDSTVKQACVDTGIEDWEGVRDAVTAGLGFHVAVRRPKMCPVHREVVDISIGSGEPQAGFNAMAGNLLGEQSCRGGWEGSCKFTPEMVTSTYWDKRQEKAEDRRKERLEAQPELVAQPGITEDSVVPEDVPVADTFADAPYDNAMDAPYDGGDAFVETTEPAMAMASSWKIDLRTAEALETVDLQQGGDGVSGPAIKKEKWTPQNMTPIDTEMSGSPVPTEHQDIATPAVYKTDAYSDDGRLEQTRAVTETQDVSKSQNPTDGGGPKTETFGGGERSAVSAVDPDKNPLRESLEELPTEDEFKQAVEASYGEGDTPSKLDWLK